MAGGIQVCHSVIWEVAADDSDGLTESCVPYSAVQDTIHLIPTWPNPYVFPNKIQAIHHEKELAWVKCSTMA